MWDSFKFNRPISPHILIYHPSLNLLKSIFHRISGLILTFYFAFFILLLKWLTIPNYLIQILFLSLKFNFILGALITFLWVYHLVSGLLHLYFNYN